MRSTRRAGCAEGRAGFTLVEVALALLVAGLGILAVFTLFPQGMESSRRSVQATEISAFADMVMNSIQMSSDTTADFATLQNNVWKSPVSHAMAYVATTQNLIQAKGRSNNGVQTFQITPNFVASIADENAYFAYATFTYMLDIQTLPFGRRAATLEVWGGDRVGPVQQALAVSKNAPDRYLFYREFAPLQVKADPP